MLIFFFIIKMTKSISLFALSLIYLITVSSLNLKFWKYPNAKRDGGVTYLLS